MNRIQSPFRTEPFSSTRRTLENNAFQLFEYSMSENLSHNALQVQFSVPTTVLPNVFIVELPDRQQICLMFATHAGVYRWLLKHPTLTDGAQPVSLLIKFSCGPHIRCFFHRSTLSRSWQTSPMSIWRIVLMSIGVIYSSMDK